MTVIFNTLLTTNDQPLVGRTVRLELVSPGFVDDQQAEIVRVAVTVTDATGKYQFVDVEPNATIDPANTYYLVHEPGVTVPWPIVVPNSGVAQWVKGLLVDPPPPGPLIVSGSVGPTGPAGPGLPPGGTAGQVPAKVDGTDYNTHWVDQSGGGGGAVSSVNGHTGTVVLAASDVGADAAGAAAAAQTAAATDATGKVATEATARIAGDAASVSTAAADATSKVAAEATARNTAIAAQHTTDVGLFDAAGAAATAQTAAAADATSKVAAEAALRTTADTTEATARAAADTAEATARAAGDALLAPLSSMKETITYNSDGTVNTVTETVSGAVTTYTYNSDGTVATESRVLGGTTLRTFSYSGGNLVGIS